MADNVARARGRARRPRQQDAPRPGAAPPADKPGPSGPRAPGQQPQPSTSVQQQQMRQQQQERAPAAQAPRGHPRSGHGTRVEAVTEQLQRVDLGGAEGGAGQGIGRGAMRGRRALQETAICTKPQHITSKKGVAGTPVQLQANFFVMNEVPTWRLYQYRVDFKPDEERTSVRKALIRVHREKFGGYLFDGTVMFTADRLHIDPQHGIMELCSERTSDSQKIIITLKEVGDLAMGDYHYLQFFNILMRKCLGFLNLQLVGRNFFDAKAKVVVQQYKMELWPGYVTSIRQHESSIMMCAEITHKVMRQDNVLDLLADIARRGDRDYQRTFKSQIIGCVVLTDYNNKTYRVDDVDFKTTPNDTFKMKSGEDITYRKYYRDRYQLEIRQADQPLLISRAKARERRAGMAEFVYLVPELCRMTGLTDEMRGNFSLMRDLAVHTRVGPSQRVQKLQQFAQRLLHEKPVVTELTEWHMQLNKDLVTFPGRVLGNEKIIQGNNKKYDAQNADWTKDLRSNSMLTNAELKNWAVIVPSRLTRDTKLFVTTLNKSAIGMRFNIPEPAYYEVPDDRAATFVDTMEKVINKQNPQLIMCVVTNQRADRYASIKKKACVDRSVATQVIQARTLNSKGVMSVATKVAIQINCKIGGAPWTVEVPLTGLMVVGFDVCHDTSNKGKSYGAMVASLDKPFSRYFSAVSAHTTGEELSNDLSLNLVKALRKYMDYNKGVLPQRIVVYRDGVGEGQVPYVFQHEVTLLQEKLNALYAQVGAQPRMAFIIVNKRINTRIFMRGENPPPGTIVDDVITMPERYDFYLVSQSVRQGTVSPTAYNVIYDNVGLDPDKLQRLTYKLTHLYYNWSGTVRVPAPCQYAHKLAYLVGQALHREPNHNMEDVLYFL